MTLILTNLREEVLSLHLSSRSHNSREAEVQFEPWVCLELVCYYCYAAFLLEASRYVFAYSLKLCFPEPWMGDLKPSSVTPNDRSSFGKGSKWKERQSEGLGYGRLSWTYDSPGDHVET